MLLKHDIKSVIPDSVRISEPAYLVRSVINHKIHDELHVTSLELADQAMNVVHHTIWTMDFAIIRLGSSQET